MRRILSFAIAGLALSFAGCSKPSATPPPATSGTGSSMTKPSSGVEGTNWRLVELDGTPIAYTGEKSPSLQLDAATQRFSGSGGCNHIMGGYTLEGGTLHFSQAAATRMACLEGMDTEAAYLQALNVIDTYRVLDGKLEIMQGDRVRARFEPVRP